MLQRIHIRDFILAKDIAFELGNGFNVITGETGAGKTIVINAVKFALGENLLKELFDFTKQQPNIELHFRIPQPESLQWFDLEPEEEVICQRVTKRNGKTITYINGVHVPLTQYRDFCRQLLQIHGQNDTEQLFSATTQKRLFDRFFSGSLPTSVEQIGSLRTKYLIMKKELKQLRDHEQEREREKDFLTFQIQEIESANLQPDEWESLLELRDRLTHRENVKSILQQAKKMFQPDQSFSSFFSQLTSLLHQMEGLQQFSEALKNLSESFQTILSLMKESERDIDHSMEAIMSEDTESLLYTTLTRIDLIKSLQRKFGNTIPAILTTKENLQKQLLQLQQEEEKSSSLANEWQTLSATLATLCINTSQARSSLRNEFVQRMEKELADLSMATVKMHIQIEQEKTTETEDSIQIQGEHYRLFPDGIDTLQYLVSTNPGQPMHPLSKIASGGELSRFMLALKSLIGKLENVDTLLFDEIDTGIGGVTANQVGVKCRDLGHDKQLICITHLPQIAAKGQHHFVINKTIHDSETSIAISPVEGEARVEEITRMLGEPYSEASKQLARSMLEWSS